MTQDPTARLDALRALLHAAVSLRRHVEQVGDRFGLSAPQARLVMTLEQPMRMREAAEATACEPSHLTLLADELSRAGILEREADPLDRRARRLRLTERGTAVRAALIPALLDGAPVVGALSPEDCSRLAALLPSPDGSC